MWVCVEKCRLSVVNFVECVVWWLYVGCVCCVCWWLCGVVRNCSAWFSLGFVEQSTFDGNSVLCRFALVVVWGVVFCEEMIVDKDVKVDVGWRQGIVVDGDDCGWLYVLKEVLVCS